MSNKAQQEGNSAVKRVIVEPLSASQALLSISHRILVLKSNLRLQKSVRHSLGPPENVSSSFRPLSSNYKKCSQNLRQRWPNFGRLRHALHSISNLYRRRKAPGSNRAQSNYREQSDWELQSGKKLGVDVPS